MTNADPIAALFDMDGVIVPNAPYHLKAWFVFAQKHGLTLTQDDYMQHMNGHVAKDSLEFLFRRSLTAADIMQYTAEKEAIYRDLYRPDLAPTPGLLSFLDELKAAGVRLAIGTAGPVDNIAFTLDGLGIRSYFDAIVDASMIQRGKPDPEVYLLAAQRVNVPPAGCIVFEDAFAGIEAGRRGGMKVVALATTHTHEELTHTASDLIIADFTGIHLNPDLLNLVTA